MSLFSPTKSNVLSLQKQAPHSPTPLLDTCVTWFFYYQFHYSPAFLTSFELGRVLGSRLQFARAQERPSAAPTQVLQRAQSCIHLKRPARIDGNRHNRQVTPKVLQRAAGGSGGASRASDGGPGDAQGGPGAHHADHVRDLRPARASDGRKAEEGPRRAGAFFFFPWAMWQT